MEKAVSVFSGGQDSTTVLLSLLELGEYDEVHTLSFSYGQRHSNELYCAKKIIQELQQEYPDKVITHKVIDLNMFVDLTSSNSLTNNEMQVDKEAKEGEVPNSYVPGRNIVFFTLASIYAQVKGAKEVFVGVSEADYSGYPDCRQAFISELETAVSLGMDTQIKIKAPLMSMTKKEVWRWAWAMDKLEYVRTMTLTCYNGIIGDGCGECPACELRNKGLRELHTELYGHREYTEYTKEEK